MEYYANEKIRYAGGGTIVSCPIVFTNDSKYFFCSSGSNIKMFSVTTGEQTRIFKGRSDTIVGIALNPANLLQFYSFSASGTICLWDFDDAIMLGNVDVGMKIRHFSLNPKNPSNIFLGTNGVNRKGLSYEIHSIDISDMTIKSKNLLFQCRAYPCNSFHTSPDGEYLIIQSQWHWYSYNMSTGKFTKYKHSKITCLLVHPKQKFVATGNENGEIVLWYIFDHQPQDKFEPVTTLLHWHHQNVGALSFDSSGMYMYSGGKECVLVMWHLESGRKEFLPRLGSPIIGINLSPDGSLLSLRLENNAIKIINTHSKLLQVQVEGVATLQGNKLLLPSGLNLEPRFLSFAFTSSQGQLQCYSPTEDRSIMKLQVGRRNQVQYFCSNQIPESIVTHIAFSNSGSWLVTVDKRKDSLTQSCLQFWYWDSSKHLYELSTRHIMYNREYIQALAYHKVHDSCLTVDVSGTFRIWKVRMQEEQTDIPEKVDRSDSFFKSVLRHRVVVSPKAEDFVWYVSAQAQYRRCPFNCAAYSSDGSLFAITYVNLITLWDEETVRLLKTFVCSSAIEPVNFIEFVNNSSKMVACTDTRTFVWDLLTCQLVWSFWMPVDMFCIDPLGDRFAIYISFKRLRTIAKNTKNAKDESQSQQAKTNGHNEGSNNVLPINTNRSCNINGKNGFTQLLSDKGSFNEQSKSDIGECNKMAFEVDTLLDDGPVSLNSCTDSNSKNLRKKITKSAQSKSKFVKTISDEPEGFVVVFSVNSPIPINTWVLPPMGIRSLSFLPTRKLPDSKDTTNNSSLIYLNGQNEFNLLVGYGNDECIEDPNGTRSRADAATSFLSHLIRQQNEFLDKLNSTRLVDHFSTFGVMYDSDCATSRPFVEVSNESKGDVFSLPEITSKSASKSKAALLPPEVVKINESLRLLFQSIFSGESHVLPPPSAYYMQFVDAITFKSVEKASTAVPITQEQKDDEQSKDSKTTTVEDKSKKDALDFVEKLDQKHQFLIDLFLDCRTSKKAAFGDEKSDCGTPQLKESNVDTTTSISRLKSHNNKKLKNSEMAKSSKRLRLSRD